MNFQNAVEEIPMRARSQSWLIRTRKIFTEEKVCQILAFFYLLLILFSVSKKEGKLIELFFVVVIVIVVIFD